jgi:hypothetical protein
VTRRSVQDAVHTAKQCRPPFIFKHENNTGAWQVIRVLELFATLKSNFNNLIMS